MSLTIDIAANLFQVRELIADSAARAGRDPASIRLIAVSKTFPPERIMEAYDCGLRDFGENRVQEFRQKFPQLRAAEATFHLIGHLQTNKVHQAMIFDWVQTVDSEKLAFRLNAAAAQAGKKMAVLIEVKQGEEETKTGVSEQETAALAAIVAAQDKLELKGLMTMPPLTREPEGARPYFRRLRQLRDRLWDAGFPQLRELSMGMSRDFPIAIEEGATMLRIGTGLFGPRGAGVAI